jgi:hypothetical protein
VAETGLPIRTLALNDANRSWEAFIKDATPLDYERERPGGSIVGRRHPVVGQHRSTEGRHAHPGPRCWLALSRVS